MLEAGIVFVGVCTCVCLSAQNLKPLVGDLFRLFRSPLCFKVTGIGIKVTAISIKVAGISINVTVA